MRRLKGKRVLITGGAGGIGRATAVRFLEEGAFVAVLDRDDRACREMEKEIRDLDGYIVADVSSPDDVAQAFEELDELFGGPDILVNNAGISLRHAFLDISLEEWRRVLEANLTGIFLVAQQAARRMLGAGEGSS